MEDIVIVSAARTAVGKFGGSLAGIPATELGALVIQEVLARAKLGNDQIGEVIMGQVLAAGVGQNPARQALIKSGIARETPALTINAVCGSGLKAVMLAAQAIATGMAFVPGQRGGGDAGIERVGERFAHANADIALEDATRPVQQPRQDVDAGQRADPASRPRQVAGLERIDGLPGEPGHREPQQRRTGQQRGRTQQIAAGAGRVAPQRAVQLAHGVAWRRCRGTGLAGRIHRTHCFNGIGVARSTGTAVTLFCGDPSISRSEYDR